MKQEDIQKAMEALGKGGIMVNGDLVLEKHVEHEIGNVEAGGIGIQIIHGREPEAPMAVTDKEIKEAKVVDEMEELIEELAPMFFNDRDEARTFVRCIQGKKAPQITDTVNMWVRDKRISDLSRYRPLWQTLHDHNLYNKSESNWNKRVR